MAWLRCILVPLSFSIKKPPHHSYPLNPTSIGQFLRRRRLDKEMLLREVAELIGVHTSVVAEWESGRKNPKAHYYPKLINFLQFIPFASRSKAHNHLFNFYRLVLGYSRREVASLVGVSYYMIYRFETGRGEPLSKATASICEKGLEVVKQLFYDRQYHRYESFSLNAQIMDIPYRCK
jgi:transcriptional regulator with XRE-family HTH domain